MMRMISLLGFPRSILDHLAMDGIACTVMHLDIEPEKHVVSEMSLMAVASIMFYMMNLMALFWGICRAQFTQLSEQD